MKFIGALLVFVGLVQVVIGIAEIAGTLIDMAAPWVQRHYPWSVLGIGAVLMSAGVSVLYLDSRRALQRDAE